METVVTIFVIAVVLSGFGTALYSVVLDSRKEAALTQLDRLKKGIVGEPRKIPVGEQNVIRHGYIGDMGILPASLANLVEVGAQPDFFVDSTLQLGVGWRGPYVPSGLQDFLTDPWGNGIVYGTSAGTSSLAGAPYVATIRSIGEDGQNGTADDHVVEIFKAESFAKVIGFVKDAFGSTLPGINVKISYPSNGAVSTSSIVSDNDGLYTFENIPHGPRVIQLEPKLSFQRGTGFTTGNDRNVVEFVVENLGKLSTSITTMKVTYTSNPPTDFAQLSINGTTISSSAGSSGTTISFSSRTVNGTGVIQEPFRVDVAGLVMMVPDAVIGTAGTGGTLTFVLNDFEEIGTNNNVDMTGVTFTLEFSDGSKTLFAPVRK